MWVNLINDSVKSDLPDKKINEEEDKHYSGEYGMKFIRVNAKEGVNINYLFEVVANFIIEKTIEKRSNSQNPKQITYY